MTWQPGSNTRWGARLVVLGVAAGSIGVMGNTAAQPGPPSLKVLMEDIRKRHGVPALATAVIVDGKTVVVDAVGVRKQGDPTPVTAEDQFHLGSCTKAMTATLIATLVDEGKLKWETTLAEAFPDHKDSMRPELRSVTLEQLLAHRGGLTGETIPEGKTPLGMALLPGDRLAQRREYARLFLHQKPPYAAGTRYEYSNAGYVLAGHAAERVTGLSWEDLMRKRLFEPLGMKSAGFGAMGTPGKVEQPWQHVARKGKEPQTIEPGPLSDNPPVVGPAGTVHASLADWAKFIAAHLAAEKGTAIRLKPETWKRLHTAVGDDYALGWVTTSRQWAGGRVLMHNGSNTMNFAVVWMAPLKNFAVLSATNMGGEGADQACDDVAATMLRRYLKK